MSNPTSPEDRYLSPARRLFLIAFAWELFYAAVFAPQVIESQRQVSVVLHLGLALVSILAWITLPRWKTAGILVATFSAILLLFHYLIGTMIGIAVLIYIGASIFARGRSAASVG